MARTKITALKSTCPPPWRVLADRDPIPEMKPVTEEPMVEEEEEDLEEVEYYGYESNQDEEESSPQQQLAPQRIPHTLQPLVETLTLMIKMEIVNPAARMKTMTPATRRKL